MATVVDETICPIPRVQLIETDGEPLESDWHRLAMNLLIDVVAFFQRPRTDYFVGGNMFIYFNLEQARNRDFRGPDFFFVKGVPLHLPRLYWAVWMEQGKYPDLIIELSSPGTIQEDLTTKKDFYETVFHTHEYFCFDPDKGMLQGWRLVDHRFEPMTPNEYGWLWCKELGLWLGTWKGKYQDKENVYLRFYDVQGNLVPTSAEGALQEALAARNQAEAAKQQAETAKQQAQTDRTRAEAAEAKLARFKAQQSP
jgi:Uma2 family endonuclease